MQIQFPIFSWVSKNLFPLKLPSFIMWQGEEKWRQSLVIVIPKTVNYGLAFRMILYSREIIVIIAPLLACSIVLSEALTRPVKKGIESVRCIYTTDHYKRYQPVFYKPGFSLDIVKKKRN